MDSKLLICGIVFVVGAGSSDFTSNSFSVDQAEDMSQFVTLLVSDSKLSDVEKSAFLQFKAKLVAYQDQFPAEESYDYWFLLRFLSAKNFCAEDAYEALEQHMAWRQDMDINNILEKDWSDMEKRFPYSKLLMQSEQLADSVALLWPLGDWDARNIVLTEQPGEEGERFVRYSSYKMMEDVSRTARVVALTMKAKGTDFSSKFNIIVDMNNGIYYNMDTNSLVDIVEATAQYYKEAIHHVIFINVPYKHPFVCVWSSKGTLTCPEESSANGGKIFSSLIRLVDVDVESNEV